MGNEAECTAHAGGKTSRGKALLETDELIFRGDFRLKLPYKELEGVRAEKGVLVLEHAGKTVRLELGDAAAKWAEKIANPKGRIDKLGVKPGQRVSIVGLDGVGFAAFVAEVRARTDDVSVGKAKAGSHAIFLGVESAAALGKIATVARSLDPAGALWTVRPKGRPEPSETQTMEAGHAAGLVDVKVVRFSETHTAEKFVIPVAKRPKK